jgi:hypothetical protein
MVVKRWGTLMGTLENDHSKNSSNSIASSTIQFRPWAPKPRFSTLEHDLVRLRSLDDRREERSLISKNSTSRMNGKLSRRPINTTLSLAVIPVRNYEFATHGVSSAGIVASMSRPRDAASLSI